VPGVKIVHPPERASPNTRLSEPWFVFVAALLVRLLYTAIARTYRVPAYDDHFAFGWEMARIARSLLAGHGYGNPFILGGTGPTAWVPPIYPLLIAGVFKAFGVYTPLAAWVLLAIQCFFSAATAPAVYEIAARCFNRRVAIWSAWIWALYPTIIQYGVRWIWETTLTTLLFAWVLVLALRMRGIGEQRASSDRQTLARWLAFAALWAAIGLCNPSLLLFLPVCGVWVLLGAQDWRRGFGRAVASGLLFLVCLAPWTVRNWRVFHAFVPIRGNFGVELYLGNVPGALGMGWGLSVATQRELRSYAAMGELRYVQEHKQMAFANIRRNPREFMELSLKRCYFFWASTPHPLGKSAFLEYLREVHYCFWSIAGLLGLALALRRRVPAAGLFAVAFFLLPLIYYAVTVPPRFRHPLEPLITILTVHLFQSARSRHSTLQPAATTSVDALAR